MNPKHAKQINAASAAVDLISERCGRTHDELRDIPQAVTALRRLAANSGINWADVMDAANFEFEKDPS